MAGDKPQPDDAESPIVSTEEAAAAFEHQVTPDTYLAIHDEVLRRWGYRCAITGAQFAPGDRPHPHLEVTAIRPLEHGGPLHASNFLPLTPAAANAFARNHIFVADDFEVWAGLGRTDPEFLESVVPLGRLLLPEREADWPDRAQLRWHRERILAVSPEKA